MCEDIGRFVEILVQTRLVGESEIRELSARLLPEGGKHDVQRFAAELIRLGKLTPYQAAAIRQGKTKGLVIGNYIVLEKIGSGGMGLVLRARHRQLQRIVALKLLPPSFSRDRAAVIRFRREAAAVAKFRHPNIVSAIDAGETHGLLFLVMEFVDGRDLAKTVKDKGPLPVAQAIDCIIQAARGLEEAHNHGIIHRDIKPANLLLDRSGTIKVLDLGLARVNLPQELVAAEGSELDLTVSGSIVGTVDYMSPEQAYDPRSADGRSDIYSLGCTLHFLLAGKPPFGGQTFMERLIGHRERPIPSLRASRRDVPPALDAAFQSLLAKSPEGRPQTMSAVIRALEECRNHARDKTSRPLMVFDDRDAATPQRKAANRAVRPKHESAPPRSELLANVFVRSRGASTDRLETPSTTRSWNRRRPILAMFARAFRGLDDFLDLRRNARFIVAALILALIVMYLWRLIR
jgi:serine/threonine protein kinase